MVLGLWISSLATAQDLNSELSLKTSSKWVSESGLEPQILQCRLSENQDLQCVTEMQLSSVKCESLHFGKLNQVKSQFKNKAFSCEGTRYETDSLLFQWRVRLQSETGLQSVWIVDVASTEQQKRLYELELNALESHTASRQYFLEGSFDREFRRVDGIAQGLGHWSLSFALGRFQIEAQRSQFFGDSSVLGSANRLGVLWAINSDSTLSAFSLKISTGQELALFKALDSDLFNWARLRMSCLGVERGWRYSSGLLSVGGGHCWLNGPQDLNFKWAPYVDAFSSYQLFSVVYLRAGLAGSWRSGKTVQQTLGTMQIQAMLGVSLTLLPE